MRMRMRIQTILSVLLLLGIMYSCTSAEQPEFVPVGDGYSLLQVAIKNTGKAPTYADYEAYAQEKEIRSVAFFTLTDDVGTFGTPGFKAGAFNKYFSTEELRSVHGLHEPLDNVGGNYTTSIRVKSDGFGTNTQVIVIANYDENGLTQTLMNVNSWDELKSVLTPEIEDEHLKTPLLMYGAASAPLTNGTTEQASIRLARIVARLDVLNQAADLLNPDKGFVLESAQLLEAKKFGFLLPGNRVSRQIPTVDSLPAVAAGNLPENDPTKITGLYLYETDNSGSESGKTSVRLKGTLFGSPFERIIPLKKPDEVGKEGDPIGLERNHRYQLTITSLTGKDLEWDVQIADWTNGSEVPVPPTLDKPALSAFTFDNGGDEARWDAATKTYTYDGTQPEVIRFTTTGTHATTYNFHCELDGKGVSIGMNNPDYPNRQRFVKRSEPVFSYSAVSQEYEITLPTVVVDSKEAVPVHIKLYIQNQANYYYADTITLQCVPNYYNTQHPPVKVGGMYWAPVNEGATTIDNTTPSRNSMGYHYQLGRNTQVEPTGTVSLVAGPVSYADAIKLYEDKFITCTAAPWDWLIAGDTGTNTRNTLWSDPAQTPCPKGWRLPTHDETIHLYNNVTKSGAGYSSTANRIIVRGDESGKDLYFPNAPYRNYTGLIYTGHSYNVWIHTSWDSANNSIMRWFYSDNHNKRDESYGAYGASIRCVQITTPTPAP